MRIQRLFESQDVSDKHIISNFYKALGIVQWHIKKDATNWQDRDQAWYFHSATR